MTKFIVPDHVPVLHDEQGRTAPELNAIERARCDTWVCPKAPGAITCNVYSDNTGTLLRLTRSKHTGRPIVERIDTNGIWGTIHFPSEQWAAKRGLT